ncbi:MAG TPA: NUDIX domain-containing protein [Holophagaceae bacterium]|nr:NUDIX domain-containing protein [Holophagaceae bacterium]
MTDVVLALIRRDGRWFLQRRDPANPVLPGLWEFPGGKTEAGEMQADALRRELREEVGANLLGARPWPVLDGPVRLHPFLVTTEEAPHTSLAWGWFTPQEMARMPVPPRNHALIERLAGLAETFPDADLIT